MWTNFRARIPEINSWLLAATFFMIPIQIAPAYIFTTFMLVLWLIEGRFVEKFHVLRREPLTWIFLAYYGVFLLSLLWTADMVWGWRMAGKQTFFLLFPLYFTVARREHVKRYLMAFLLAIGMCEMLAYYNWVDLNFWHALPDGIRADKSIGDTAPFVDRILYTPALALGGYLAGHQVLFARGRLMKWACALLFVTTVINLIFSGGRAGMVGFLALVAVLVFQRFSRRPFIAGVAACLAVVVICGVAYKSATYFRDRVDMAIENVVHYDTKINTSVGLRLTYWSNAWRIFIENPVLGVGAGDYPTEYNKMNAKYSPEWQLAWNPHNQYLLALTSAGLLGGIALLLTLGYPLARFNPQDGLQYLRIAVPILFIVICMFESYLMRSNTSMAYVLFSAILWRDAPRSSA